MNLSVWKSWLTTGDKVTTAAELKLLESQFSTCGLLPQILSLKHPCDHQHPLPSLISLRGIIAKGILEHQGTKKHKMTFIKGTFLANEHLS